MRKRVFRNNIRSHIFGHGKKGVSPLIATVLLIAFAVALGAVVMNWGTNFVKEQTQKTEDTTNTKLGCALRVSLKISEIDSTPQLCYGGGGEAGYIEMRLDNNDETTAIGALSVSVGGEKGVYNNESINTTIPIGLSAFVNLSYSYASYGKIKTVKIVPQIRIGGTLVSCGGSSLQKSGSELRNCSA